MATSTSSIGTRAGLTATIRARIEQGGERLWRHEDFADLPFSAVAQALSRLVKAHHLERLSKGVYYRARQTAFGKSKPNPTELAKLTGRRKSVFPAGVAAASMLGLTTQTARRGEVATNATSLPRKLMGTDTVIHTRRPEAWARLTPIEASILDVFRNGGESSDLSPAETIARLQKLLKEEMRLKHLLAVASDEPPRVRALLGAFAEHLGEKPSEVKRLRASLNPFTRFDFGVFSRLPDAKTWQAKEVS